MSEKIEFTEEQIVAAFTEWERRYREEPERFMSEAVKLLRQTPETYGHAATRTFLFYVQESGLTPRAPDAGDSAASTSSLHASTESTSEGNT